jgi:hypothetical protein
MQLAKILEIKHRKIDNQGKKPMRVEKKIGFGN